MPALQLRRLQLPRPASPEGRPMNRRVYRPCNGLTEEHDQMRDQLQNGRLTKQLTEQADAQGLTVIASNDRYTIAHSFSGEIATWRGRHLTNIAANEVEAYVRADNDYLHGEGKWAISPSVIGAAR